jgi:hypothetical protein
MKFARIFELDHSQLLVVLAQTQALEPAIRITGEVNAMLIDTTVVFKTWHGAHEALKNFTQQDARAHYNDLLKAYIPHDPSPFTH